jgi:hypothetical protein
MPQTKSTAKHMWCWSRDTRVAPASASSADDRPASSLRGRTSSRVSHPHHIQELDIAGVRQRGGQDRSWSWALLRTWWWYASSSLRFLPSDLLLPIYPHHHRPFLPSLFFLHLHRRHRPSHPSHHFISISIYSHSYLTYSYLSILISPILISPILITPTIPSPTSP